jgi:dTDP-4-amino-4,6-dideoxy-D-galactose acyltransferase
MIEHLPWDSEFFGFKTGRVSIEKVAGLDLAQLHANIQQQQYRLVYLMFPGLHLESKQAEADEFHQLMNTINVKMVDRKVIYSKKVNPCLKNFRSHNISAESSIPVPEKLQHLALQAGINSRFRTDPHFPEHLFKRMYIEWLLKSLTGELATEVLLWLDEYRQIQGFITVKHHGGYSEIGLIAVDEASRGQNAGTMLLKASEASAAVTGNSLLKVGTQQDNFAACRFYERYGFETESITGIYHWWE